MKKFEDLTYNDLDSQRYLRATRFANAVQGMMRDFLPPDRECSRLIYDYLMKLGYETNAEIINVPPEYDGLTKLQLERVKLETHPAYVKLGGA